MVPDFRRNDVWTPAFAGVTLQETFYETIMIDFWIDIPDGWALREEISGGVRNTLDLRTV